MKYMTVNEAAELWNLTPRRVRVLCNQKKIEGVIKEKGKYLIPLNTPRPTDRRKKVLKMNPEYSSLFQEIDLLKSKLNQLRPFTEGELRQLQEEFLVEFTYNSNAIEGNTLTLQETAMVLEGVTIDQKPLREHLEAIGHRDAFLYIQELSSQKKSFTEKDILTIHSLVLIDRPEDKGVYRRIPVRIMGAYHIPPQPYRIPKMMEDLMSEMKKSTLHPIEKAALFHLHFEGIHPFIDGNGRTGRLIMNLMLMQRGYPPIDVKFTDRKKYYQSFDTYYRENSSKEMVELISEYVRKKLKRYLEILAIK